MESTVLLKLKRLYVMADMQASSAPESSTLIILPRYRRVQAEVPLIPTQPNQVELLMHPRLLSFKL